MKGWKKFNKWGAFFVAFAVMICTAAYLRTFRVVVTIPPDDVPLAGGYNLYTVELSKFGISGTGTNARETTDGINEAITWAKSNGYSGVSLPSGTYLIQCKWGDPNTLPNDGILVPSDTILDLSKATLKIESNGQPAYNLIYTLKASNITINGGTLVGDKDSHSYSGGSTHEWGSGINVVASSNVTIQNMNISSMTGDAITIRGGGGVNSSDFKINNNRLYRCRRQGISVTGGMSGTISNNTIYYISGTDPQAGIDIEANAGYDAQNLVIQSNKISDCSGASIQCYNGSNYSMIQNTCTNGGILVGSRTRNLVVKQNILVNSLIRIMSKDTGVQLVSNKLDRKSRVDQK